MCACRYQVYSDFRSFSNEKRELEAWSELPDYTGQHKTDKCHGICLHLYWIFRYVRFAFNIL